MKNIPPLDSDRLIHEAISRLGWDVDPRSVADKVKRLDIGLPREDEFSVICGWLGRCSLIHKLDQQQTPSSSKKEFQVPDLLAVFDVDGNKIKILIEVKSSTKNTLSMRPDYLKKLKNYAALLELPLLFAWKFHGIWILFDSGRLEKANKNFNISFNEAIKSNLLGVMCGDFSYKLGKGAGLIFKFRKEKLIKENPTEDGDTQEWLMVVEDVSFTDYLGEKRTDLDPGVQSLFVTWDLTEKEEHTDKHINLRFMAGDEGILFAHMALVHLLNWPAKEGEKIHWRHLLAKEEVVKDIANFSKTVETAMREKIVSHVFHQQPVCMPAFLKNG